MEENIQTGEAQAQAQTEEQVNAEALKKYNESQERIKEAVTGQADGVPEGFNADGTPIEPTEKIGGKFDSQEDLLKAYQELEAKLGGKQDEAPADEAPKADEAKADEPKVDDVANDSAYSKFHEEYNASGELSEDSYKELAEKGFSKEEVDAYIEGQNALADKFSQELFTVAGGEDAYNELVVWAADNADADTINEYNEAITRGDTKKITQLVEYMALKKQSLAPTAPNRLEGASTAETGGMKAFNDKGEWQAAMNNPLYGKDAKYTNMVDKRYLASTRQGRI